MCNGDFEDMFGFVVTVGTMVSFTEFYVTPDMPDLVYMVVDLPNCGDMVVMAEISVSPDNYEIWEFVTTSPVISVEPWKIASI